MSSRRGKGNYTASNQVIAAITARVIDVLDNSNLLIEGRRSVKVNSDAKTILITGIVRTADIHSDNTVRSEKAAQLPGLHRGRWAVVARAGGGLPRPHP